MKRKKKANRQGSVTKTKKNKPYWVRVTDPATGKRKSLGIYATRTEAQEILNNYLVNPYEIDNSKIIFSELYKLFISNQREMVKKATLDSYKNSYKRCEPLHSLVFREIKGPQMQQAINNLNTSSATKQITKNFLTTLFNYGIELEIITVNRAKYIKIPKESVQKEKNIFSSYEIQKLWNNISTQWVDYILIMIYTGMRIGELAGLKKENVDLLQGFINGGNKTEKGKNRQIPIHKDIFQLIKGLYEKSPTDYLLYNQNWIFKKKEKENKPLRINFFREHFYKTLESLGMSHKPHDCRKTLSTLMSRQQLTTTAITDILGHENIETTNKFYIKTDKENLKAEMNNIKFYSDESNMTN